MKPKIIRAEELKENDHGDTKTTSILSVKGLKFNIAKIRKVGNNIKLGYDTESDVAYYVLEGEGDCVINGETYHLKKGDCVFIVVKISVVTDTVLDAAQGSLGVEYSLLWFFL